MHIITIAILIVNGFDGSNLIRPMKITAQGEKVLFYEIKCLN